VGWLRQQLAALPAVASGGSAQLFTPGGRLLLGAGASGTGSLWLIPEVQQAIEDYHRYQQLTEQYARQIIEQTRTELNISVKKRTAFNPPRFHPKSGLPKTRKSST